MESSGSPNRGTVFSILAAALFLVVVHRFEKAHSLARQAGSSPASVYSTR